MNNGKWTAFAIAYLCIFAYAISLIVYQFGLVLPTGAFTIATFAAIVAAIALVYLLLRPGKEKNRPMMAGASQSA